MQNITLFSGEIGDYGYFGIKGERGEPSFSGKCLESFGRLFL